MNSKIVKSHLSLLAACSMWGLMSPVGKAAMEAGVSSLSLASFRIMGATICFWIASLFAPKEKVDRHDMPRLFFAGLLCVAITQGLFILGLSLTSPIDSTVITTSLPVITMILAALFLKEPITPVKVIGVALGVIGALILVFSNHGDSEKAGNIWGDILCFVAQISFACYLTLFKGLISRYNIFTLMKWMFTYSSLCYIFFTYKDLSNTFNRSLPVTVWLQIGYVIVFGTFLANILILVGQKTLRPTVVSMYNYMQPIVGAGVAVLIGMGTFGWVKAFATALIFIGVYVVTNSKSRDQMLQEGKRCKLS